MCVGRARVPRKHTLTKCRHFITCICRCQGKGGSNDDNCIEIRTESEGYHIRIRLHYIKLRPKDQYEICKFIQRRKLVSNVLVKDYIAKQRQVRYTLRASAKSVKNVKGDLRRLKKLLLVSSTNKF